jgi:PST family polysaccharide transporter
MSIVDKAFKGAIWLTLFRGSGQIFSWLTTIIVARILSPSDYGLMDMATILTGYVVLFSSLGLGMAIIQRENITENALSSLFWLLVSWGFFLAIVCLFLAYPTVAIFNEPRLLRVTQSVSILFLVGGLLIVPNNILQ